MGISLNHLSYIGDTNIGQNSKQAGAGTITCNYDGAKKYKTKIKIMFLLLKEEALVAPITLNNNSIIGAGSVITKMLNLNHLH